MVSVAKLDDLSVVAGTRKADKNTPITDVVIKDGKIYFTTQEDGQTFVYQTGAINDPQLVDRLLKAKSSNPGGKIAFNQEMPQKNSPLLDFILMWVLPGLIFYLIWRQTSKAIQSRMGGGGGNFMSFGKSGGQNLCRFGREDYLCRCGRAGRGQGGPDRNRGLPAQSPQIL